MNLEEAVELERLAATHELATAKDDDVVGDEHGDGCAEGGHWCFTLLETEVLRLVALEGDEDLFEDGP